MRWLDVNRPERDSRVGGDSEQELEVSIDQAISEPSESIHENGIVDVEKQDTLSDIVDCGFAPLGSVMPRRVLPERNVQRELWVRVCPFLHCSNLQELNTVENSLKCNVCARYIIFRRGIVPPLFAAEVHRRAEAYSRRTARPRRPRCTIHLLRLVNSGLESDS